MNRRGEDGAGLSGLEPSLGAGNSGSTGWPIVPNAWKWLLEWRGLVPLLLALGIAWSCWLISRVPDEVFYSGDGGVKALLVKQFLRGEITPELRLPASAPVAAAWRDGLYPLRPPFVYPTSSGQLVSFPVAFAVVSLPFYAALGLRGLYVVPAISLWLTWWWFARTLARERVPRPVRALGVALLVFATHATLYTATFWEHTLGVLLVYAGIDFAFSHTRRRTGALPAALAGVVCGLAFSVRSEALLLALALAVSVLLARRQSVSAWPAFLGGLAASLGGVLLLNAGIYGHPLGIHSRQVLEESSLVGQLLGAVSRAVKLVGNLSLHVPVFALAVGVAASRWLRTRRLDFRDPAAILLPCLAFLVAVPFVVPNPGARQMGPRYLLCMVPAVVLAGVMLLGQLRTTRARNLLLAGLGFSLVLGVVQNGLIQAPRMTREYEERILPALRFLRSRPSKLVLVNDSRLTQELEAELGPKEFVLAHRRPAVVRALEAARQLGEPRPLLLSFEEHDNISDEVPPSIPVRSLGIHGGIRFFEVTLPPPLPGGGGTRLPPRPK